MLPWLQLNALGYIANFIRLAYTILFQGVNLSTFLMSVILNIVVVGKLIYMIFLVYSFNNNLIYYFSYLGLYIMVYL